MRRFLVVDIGTSSLKSAIIDETGRLLATDRRRVKHASEQVSQFETRRWMEALAATTAHLLPGVAIDAVVLSGNGPTVVAVNEAGQPIGPPLLWLDERTEPLDGLRSFYLPRIAWFDRHCELADDVRWYLPFPEFLVYMLTGEALATSPSDEFSRVLWTDQECAAYRIDAGTLPPIVPVGTLAGGVHHAGSASSGIPEGTPVVAAGSDFLMSLVGTATMVAGRTCDRAGTSEGINHCAERPVDRSDLRTLPHVVAGLYNVAGILSSTGLLFEWFREISGQGGVPYTDMMTAIIAAGERDPASVPWFFPSVHRGPSWEFQRGMFIGLGAEHDRAAMGRAVVLSIGFAVHAAVASLGSAGLEVQELRSCGGQAKNPLWNQMKADMVGVPVVIPEVVDAELAGNLCAGLVALGEASSLTEASERVVRVAHTFEPNAAQHARYVAEGEQYTQRYERFRQALELCDP